MMAGAVQLLTTRENVLESMVYAAYGADQNAETIIVLHGSPGDKNDLSVLGAALADSYRVYALDLPCFGEQGLNSDDCGIDGAADAVATFMDEQSIEKAHVLGYSWGGGVAQTFAARYPEKTQTLTLLASMGLPEGEITGSYRTERIRTFAAYPFVVYYPGVFGKGISWREGFMRSYLETDLRTTRASLAHIEAPTLVLHGTRDTIVEPWVAEAHAQLIQKSELVWFTGNHHTVYSNVTEISAAIHAFIEQHTTKGAEAGLGPIIKAP